MDMDMIGRAMQMHTVLSWQLQGLTDEQAVQVPDLYPAWQPEETPEETDVPEIPAESEE